MTWSLIAPYLYRQVELGNMTKEEADKELQYIIEVDLEHNKFDSEILKLNVVDESNNLVANTDFIDEQKNLKVNDMTEKEKLIEYINKPITTDARNRMGCSENWYNPYYAIKETFSIDEIQSMSDKEIDNLVRLADEIQLSLY